MTSLSRTQWFEKGWLETSLATETATFDSARLEAARTTFLSDNIFRHEVEDSVEQTVQTAQGKDRS